MIFRRSFRRLTHGLQCVKKKVTFLSRRLLQWKNAKPKLRRRRRMISMQCVMVQVSFNWNYFNPTHSVKYILCSVKFNSPAFIE